MMSSFEEATNNLAKVVQTDFMKSVDNPRVAGWEIDFHTTMQRFLAEWADAHRITPTQTRQARIEAFEKAWGIRDP